MQACTIYSKLPEHRRRALRLDSSPALTSIFAPSNVDNTPSLLEPPLLFISPLEVFLFFDNNTRAVCPSSPYRPRRIPIPGFKEFGVGDHESHPTPAMLKELGFKEGVVTTGSSFDSTDTDDKIMEENGEDVLRGD